MIDTAELRRLAKIAIEIGGNGPWVKKDSFEVTCDTCGDVVCACDVTSSDEYQTAYIQICGMEPFAVGIASYIAAANPAASLELLDRLDAAEKVCAVKFIKRTITDNPKEFECPYCQQRFVHYDKHTQMDLPYCGSCGRAILDAADNYCGVCGVKLEWKEAQP